MYYLRTLGDLGVYDSDGNTAAPIHRQPHRIALLVYLATHVGRHLHSRSALLGTFWPGVEATRSRNSLRQALHFLRSHLGDDLFENHGYHIAINQAVLRSDVRCLEADVAAGDHEKALQNYGGIFLDNVHLSDHPDFRAWVDGQRAWLSHVAVQCALRAAARARDEGDATRQVSLLSRASSLAPYDEAVARALFDARVTVGNHGAALEQLRDFTDRLERDLDVTPAPQTLALLRDVRLSKARGVPARTEFRGSETSSYRTH